MYIMSVFSLQPENYIGITLKSVKAEKLLWPLSEKPRGSYGEN